MTGKYRRATNGAMVLFTARREYSRPLYRYRTNGMPRTNPAFRAELVALLPRLRRFGLLLAGSTDHASDLVQDCVEKALRREHQFEPGTRMDSWMFRMMQTTWIDRTRSAKVRTATSIDLDGAVHIAGEDGRTSFPARIEFEQTRKAMARLPEEFRTALALVSIEGLTYIEAAGVLDVPVGTIMSRVSRARSLLVGMLAQPGRDQ
jgi:RNA polymerase sigma-70 factor (ECF subfamily)